MAVRYVERPPDPRLAARVACHWTIESTSSHLVLPDGCMDLLFEGGRAVLVGTSTVAFVVPPAGRVHGVRFAPGEAYAIAGIAGHELVDGVADMPAFRELAERIAEGAEPAPLLERALLAMPARPADPRVRRAVAALLADPSRRVEALARDLGLSERQLERGFAERVGVAPKQLARAARLHAMLRAQGTLGARAAAAGFADQAHLAREVKRLTGLTPTELTRAAAWPVTMSASFKRSPAGAATTCA